jgi:hypothetical protein
VLHRIDAINGQKKLLCTPFATFSTFRAMVSSAHVTACFAQKRTVRQYHAVYSTAQRESVNAILELPSTPSVHRRSLASEERSRPCYGHITRQSPIRCRNGVGGVPQDEWVELTVLATPARLLAASLSLLSEFLKIGEGVFCCR